VKILYDERFNIDLGLLNKLHPFDGRKFRRVREGIAGCPGLDFVEVDGPVPPARIAAFTTPGLRQSFTDKRSVLRALELPWLPLIPLSLIDRRLLATMRLAAGATLQAARLALAGATCWSLSGGYHHAGPGQAEGFCLYNDIGMAVQDLRETGALAERDEILLVDIDAHHGNGNARTFLDDARVTLLDIYNAAAYPHSPDTRDRVDIKRPLRPRTTGAHYLAQLDSALRELQPRYRLAFVIAGTDVLQTDPLGGLALTLADCVARDTLVLDRLQALGIPAVVVGGGGYGPDSATAMIRSVTANAHR